MPLLIKDRVREVTTSVGTGPIVVGTSLVTGFQSIASTIGDGNTTPYVIEVPGGSDWEIGIGQYISSNTSILRLQVLASSNSNNLVNFSAGAKNVFITLPATYAALTARDLSQFAATTSAQLASVITDETGTGKLVFSDNAVLVAPNIGTANGTALTLSGDLNVSGNIYLAGNTTTLSSNNLFINDPMIYLANNNSGNINDIGIVGHFVSTKYQHTGFVRDATDGIWKLFSNVSAEPASTIDFSTDVVYDPLQVGSVTATTFTGALYGNANTVTNGIYSTDTGTVTNTMLFGGISNVKLSNSSVTITPGTGLNGGGIVSLGSSITLNVNSGSTTVAGILQLNNTISSTSTTLAATANAVKTAYDLATTANTNASNASVLTTGTVPNARLVSIPNSALANSSVTITPGTGLNGGGTVVLGSSITLNVNSGSTTVAGILQLTDSISSTSTITAATANTVKTVYDLATTANTNASNASVLTIGTVPNARLVSIPNSSLANTSVTITPGTGLNGGGTVVLGSSITLNVNSGSTTVAGILQLIDSISSTSTALAATANAVKTAYDLATTANTNASNASVLTTGTVPNSLLVSIPNSSLANTSVTITPGTGLNGGGTVVLGSSVTLNANTASTTAAGIVQLTDSISSTSTTTAATPNSVTNVYNFANSAYNKANTAIYTAPGISGNVLTSNGTAWVSAAGASPMVYPGAGIPNSTGTSWGTSYGVLGTGSIPGSVVLSTAPSNGQLLIGNGTAYIKATLTQGSGISITNGSGAITISSNVSLSETFTFGGTGTPTTGTALTPYLYVTRNMTCNNAVLIAKTAPTGNFTVNILRSSDNGTSFPDIIAIITITSGNRVGITALSPTTTPALVAGDLLRLDISAVNGASDWTAQLNTLL